MGRTASHSAGRRSPGHRSAVTALLTLALLAGVLAAPAAAVGDGGFDGNPATTERIADDHPVTAAIAVGVVRFADDAARHVALSRDDDFPDSLAGAPLTAEGPLLLTDTDQAAVPTLAEIERVLPPGGQVYLLGGEAAIGPLVERQIEDRGLVPVRLSGPTRVETAIAVADEVRRLHPGSSWVALARAAGPAGNPSAGWADSVTGGAWAAAFPTPVLVTPTDEVHPAVAAALERYDPERTVLLGGTAALSADVEAAVPNPLRVAGDDRSQTAAAVAQQLWPGEPGRYVVINGYRPDGWAFGLPAAGLAADAGAPLLLSQAASVPDATAAEATGCTDVSVDVLLVGSTDVLSDAVADDLDAVDGIDCRDRLTPTSVVTYDGIGPVRVGMTVEEAEDAAGVDLEGSPELDNGCYYVSPVDEEFAGISFMVTDDTIARVDVFPPYYVDEPDIPLPDVTTVEGARIGDTEDDIEALYPGQVEVFPHEYVEGGHYLAVLSDDPALEDYALVFETDGTQVTAFRAGRLPEVEYVEGCA